MLHVVQNPFQLWFETQDPLFCLLHCVVQNLPVTHGSGMYLESLVCPAQVSLVLLFP